jgi:hypothetical protein
MVPSWSYKIVWHIPLLCVQWNTPDDGQRNCPKHVEFHSKNKFEKLVHLVGFIIRIQGDMFISMFILEQFSKHSPSTCSAQSFGFLSVGSLTNHRVFTSKWKRRGTSRTHVDACHTTSQLPRTFEKVRQSIVKRVCAFIGSGGAHLEHVLWIFIL